MRYEADDGANAIPVDLAAGCQPDRAKRPDCDRAVAVVRAIEFNCQRAVGQVNVVPRIDSGCTGLVPRF